jgi:hypothetical protein
MKMRASILCVMVLSVALSACTRKVNKVMQSWVGHHYSELIAVWGPPSQIIEDKNGGKTIIYAHRRTYKAPDRAETTIERPQRGTGDVRAETVITPGQTWNHETYRVFYTDANGIIQGWGWRGF